MFQPSQQGQPQGNQPQGPPSLAFLTASDFYPAHNGAFAGGPSHASQVSSKTLQPAISPAGQAPSMMQGQPKPGQQQPFPLSAFSLNHLSAIDPAAASPGAPPLFAHPQFPGILAQIPQNGQPQQGQHQGGPPTPQPQQFFQLQPHQLQQTGQQGAPMFPPRMPTSQAHTTGGPGAPLISPATNLQNIMATLTATFGKSMNVGSSAAGNVGSHSPSPHFQQAMCQDRSKFPTSQPQQQQHTGLITSMAHSQAPPSSQQQTDAARKLVADWNSNTALAAMAQGFVRPQSQHRNSPPVSSQMQMSTIFNQQSFLAQQKTMGQQQITQSKPSAGMPSHSIFANQPQNGMPSNQNIRMLGGLGRPGSASGTTNLQQPSPSMSRFQAPGTIGNQAAPFAQHMAQGRGPVPSQQGAGGMSSVIRMQQHQQHSKSQFGSVDRRQAGDIRSMSPKFFPPTHPQNVHRPSAEGVINQSHMGKSVQQSGQRQMTQNVNGRPSSKMSDDFRRQTGTGSSRTCDDVRVLEQRRGGGTPDPTQANDSLNLPAPPPFPGNDFATRLTMINPTSGRPSQGRRDGSAVRASSGDGGERNEGDYSSDQRQNGNMPAVPPIPPDLRMLMSGMWPAGGPSPQLPGAIPPPLLDHHRVASGRGSKMTGSNNSRRGSSHHQNVS